MCVLVCPLSFRAKLQRIVGVMLCTLVVATTLVVDIGCGKSGAKPGAAIHLVRNGFLKIRHGDATVKTYNSATVGNALERKFKNGIWRQFTTSTGVVVEFDAPVSPATLYRNGFAVWVPFSDKKIAAAWGAPGEKGSLSLRSATTCINDDRKRVLAHGGGRIVTDCRLLFQVQFTVSANGKNFDLRYISLATFNTDDQGEVLSYIYG